MTDKDENLIVGRPEDAIVKEWVMPHAIQVVPETTYKARATRAKYHPGQYGQTSIFHHNDEGVIVGEEAITTNDSGKLTGPAKYKEGYLDRLLLAALTKLFPDGHNNIVVACAHTTNAIPFIDKIGEIVNKRHEITRIDGEKVRYSVRAMVPWDEPAGGLNRFKNRPHAQYNSEDIQIGDRIAVIDVGGKISSLYPVLVLPGNNYQILWDQGRSFNVGIQNVDEQLQQELPSLYSETFQVRNIPLSVRESILRTGGEAKIRTKKMNFYQAYLNSTSIMTNVIQNFWENEFDQGLNINHILATGGGSGVMFKSLLETVFEEYKDAAYLADLATQIELANLRGGEYASSIWMADNKHLFEKSGRMPVVCIIFDPGNSNLKFKILGAGYNAA